MKKTTGFLVLALIIIGGAYLIAGRGDGKADPKDTDKDDKTVSVSETTKSGKMTEYQNSELGFSVKYPSNWEIADADNIISFVMPIPENQVTTIATLKSDITVLPGKCTFPPVTTVKERKPVTFGANSFNMISMENNVQGRTYFNRMYSIDKNGICYMFSFASIALSPAAKNLTGSNLTQAQNNNKALVSTADTEFTEMVKSFTFVTGPQGEDETKVKTPQI